MPEIYIDGIQKDIKDCFAHRFRRFYGVVQNGVTHLILPSGALRALIVGGGVTPGCVALAGSSPGVMFVTPFGLGTRQRKSESVRIKSPLPICLYNCYPKTGYFEPRRFY